MVELSSRDRLQPSLLDRLIDHEPGSRTDSAEERSLTRPQLRAAVLRDLSWLFNAVRSEPEPGSERVAEQALWQRFELARRSALNFGLPAFSGATLSSLDLNAMRRVVAEAIKTFEPRIDPKTLSIDVHTTGIAHHNSVQITIKGNMWAQPVPLELLLRADVDVETGSAQVRDLRS